MEVFDLKDSLFSNKKTRDLFERIPTVLLYVTSTACTGYEVGQYDVRVLWFSLTSIALTWSNSNSSSSNNKNKNPSLFEILSVVASFTSTLNMNNSNHHLFMLYCMSTYHSSLNQHENPRHQYPAACCPHQRLEKHLTTASTRTYCMSTVPV